MLESKHFLCQRPDPEPGTSLLDEQDGGIFLGVLGEIFLAVLREFPLILEGFSLWFFGGIFPGFWRNFLCSFKGIFPVVLGGFSLQF